MLSGFFLFGLRLARAAAASGCAGGGPAADKKRSMVFAVVSFTSANGAVGTMRPAPTHLGETGPLSKGVQEGRQALRILHIHGMVVHGKRPREFK
jgi:hypothetical protein